MASAELAKWIERRHMRTGTDGPVFYVASFAFGPVSICPIGDPTEPEEPLICPGCGAVGDAACRRGCLYRDEEPHGAHYAACSAALADLYLDEQASSDADPAEVIF